MEEAGQGSVHIRTPDQRLRVFVISTLAELAPEGLRHDLGDGAFGRLWVEGRDREPRSLLPVPV